MLPRGVAKKEAPEENRRFVMDLAEALYPDVEHIDQLSDADKKSWIHTADLFLRDDLVDRLFSKFGKELAPAVEAEVDDILKRQEFDFANGRDRIAAEIQERAEKKQQREERHEDIRQGRVLALLIARERWEVEKDERLTSLRNRSRRENMALAVAVAASLMVGAICIVALAEHRTFVVGGFGGLLAAAVGVVIREFRP